MPDLDTNREVGTASISAEQKPEPDAPPPRRVQRQLKSPLKTRLPSNHHLPTNRQKHQSRSRPRRENQTKR